MFIFYDSDPNPFSDGFNFKNEGGIKFQKCNGFSFDVFTLIPVLIANCKPLHYFYLKLFTIKPLYHN